MSRQATAVLTSLVLMLGVPTAAVGGATVANRIGGDDRFETAQLVYETRFPGGSVPYVVAASGLNWPDALAAAPAAAVGSDFELFNPVVPVILTRETNGAWLTYFETKWQADTAFVAGSDAVVSDATLVNLAMRTETFTATRLAGPNRYATAAALSKRFFPTADEVFITTGADFPDALGAGAAAAARGAPLLLVTPTAVPAVVGAELARLSPTKIYVIGGTSAVSAGVQAALRTYTESGTTSSVERIAGANRYTTAVAVSRRFFGPNTHVYVATGTNYADALVVGPLGQPILLVPPTSAPQAVLDEIARLQGGVVILGSYGAVSQTVEDQINAVLASR